MPAHRRRLLQAIFSLLYGPLAPVHEGVGTVAFGAAWPRRRMAILDRLGEISGVLLDLGCGDGRLLAEARRRGIKAVGLEPSRAMSRGARRRGDAVVRGSASHIPLRTGSITVLCSTYPGPWIAEPATWREIGRVVRPGGRVVILLGGTVERGRMGRLRSFGGALVYGARGEPPTLDALPKLGDDAVHGGWETAEDAWGTVITWEGTRVG